MSRDLSSLSEHSRSRSDEVGSWILAGLGLASAAFVGAGYFAAPLSTGFRFAGLTWAGLMVAGFVWTWRRPAARAPLSIFSSSGLAGAAAVLAFVLWQAGYAWADWPAAARASLGWVAVLLAFLALAGPRLTLVQALLVLLSVAASGWLARGLLPRPVDQLRLAAWELGNLRRPVERFERGRAISNPEIGFDYEPGTIWKTYYPDNPAAAFRGEPLGWDLACHQASSARLDYPGGAQGPVRVIVDPAGANHLSEVELAWSRVAVETGNTYHVELRARASTSVSLGCYIGAADAPYDLATEYAEIPLGSAWRTLRIKLVATRTEPQARLVFQLGHPGLTLELADVGLWRDGNPVPRQNGPDDFRTPFAVSYEMNSLGFRDRDYAIPRPPGTLRIVCLGDSLGFGYGVAGDEAVSERLEASLTARAAAAAWQTPIEVINACRCGFGPRDERRSFELVSSRYEPQLVVLLASPTDEANFADDVARGIIRAGHGPVIEPARDGAPLPGMEGAMAEIRLLDEACRQRGARLEVMIFQHLVFDRWARRSADDLAQRLAASKIPWFDLGKLPDLVAHQRIITVHPTDPHPSEVVHRLAAAELEKRLWPVLEQLRSKLAP